MKDYYQILRISRNAGDQDIKRAYRRLAVLFHPDKNQSADALVLFQEINEAHEVLSDPSSRHQYDQLLNGTVVVEQDGAVPWHRDPAYRRRHEPGYRPPRPQPSERLLMMLHLLKYLRTISISGIAWCALLLVDYMLPFRASNELVLPDGNQVISWQYHHEPNLVVTDKGFQVPVPLEGLSFFPAGSRVDVITSRVLHILVKVESQGKTYTIDSVASIYQNLLIIPILLLLVSAAGLFVEEGIEFRFNILVSICILLGFNLIFLLFSIV